MDELEQIKQELAAIRERNKRVEADKAWETSRFRTLSITIITYIVAALVMYLIDVKDFLLNALVPTAGFFLSIQSLPSIKNWWVGRCFK